MMVTGAPAEYRRVCHASVAMVGWGIGAAGALFEIAAQFTATPCSDFVRPVAPLLIMSIALSTLAAHFGVVELVRERDGDDRWSGRLHVYGSDLAGGMLVLSLWVRDDLGNCWVQPPVVPALTVTGTLIGSVALLIGLRWLRESSMDGAMGASR